MNLSDPIELSETVKAYLDKLDFDMLDQIAILSYLPGMIETIQATGCNLTGVQHNINQILFSINNGMTRILVFKRGVGGEEFVKMCGWANGNWMSSELVMDLDTTEEHVLYYTKRVCNWAQGKGPRR